MNQQYATPPRFGTMPLDDGDDLFQLHPHTCADCGASFETSRRATYCALCASLRNGQVGPATVVCPGCGLEHQLPVLAPTKLCGPCRLDLDITASALRARLDAAELVHSNAFDRLTADIAHADEKDHARYEMTIAKEHEWDAERWRRAVDAAIAKGDGLSPILVALLAMRSAYTALLRVRGEVATGLEEIASVRARGE